MLKNLIIRDVTDGERLESARCKELASFRVDIIGFTLKEYNIIRSFVPEEELYYGYRSQTRTYCYKTSVNFFIAAIPILKEMGYEIIDQRKQEKE